jgi:hypothetical protein|tara:strand:+ start:80 stop:865 length:786 start_codon:yes stop_codon:yes gene_type:complete
MATFDETIAGAYAGPGGLIEGYRSLIQQSNMPTGAQLAPGLTQQQLDAQQLLTSGIGSYQPFLTAGSQALQASMGATGPQAMQAYMNPYIQDVVDTTTADLQRQFGVQQAQETQRQIQSGGMRGAATRGAIADAELARTQGETMANALARLRFGAAGEAQQAAQQAAQTQAGIGQLYGQMGALAQTGLMGDVQGLYGMGEDQRQILGQQNLLTYQTPFYGLGQFASALRGSPTFQSYGQVNPVLTGITAAMGGGGAQSLFG